MAQRPHRSYAPARRSAFALLALAACAGGARRSTSPFQPASAHAPPSTPLEATSSDAGSDAASEATSDESSSTKDARVVSAAADWLRAHPEVVTFSKTEIADGWARTRLRTTARSTICVQRLATEASHGAEAWCWSEDRPFDHLYSWGWDATDAGAEGPSGAAGFVGAGTTASAMEAWAIRVPAGEWVKLGTRARPTEDDTHAPSWWPAAPPSAAAKATLEEALPKTGWAPLAKVEPPDVGALAAIENAFAIPAASSRAEDLSGVSLRRGQSETRCVRSRQAWTCEAPELRDDGVSSQTDVVDTVPSSASNDGATWFVLQRSTQSGGSTSSEGDASLEVLRAENGVLAKKAWLVIGRFEATKMLDARGNKERSGRAAMDAWFLPHAAAGAGCLRIGPARTQSSIVPPGSNVRVGAARPLSAPREAADLAGVWRIDASSGHLSRVATEPRTTCARVDGRTSP